jgi:hypothetical protein
MKVPELLIPTPSSQLRAAFLFRMRCISSESVSTGARINGAGIHFRSDRRRGFAQCKEAYSNRFALRQ